MAGTSYTRQSTIADGNIISASLFNNEFNQILNAFAYASTGTTGHQHDGGAGEGGNIAKIGDQDFLNKIEVSATNNRIEFYAEVGGSPVEQVRIQDGAIVPVTDSDVDLGTTSVRFKDAFVDSATVTGAVSATTVTSSGTTNIVTGVVTGDLTLTGADYNIVFDASASELKFNDNAELLIGTGNDLKIYHDGSNTRIREQGVGGLYITADSFTSFGSSNGAQSLIVNASLGTQFLALGNSKMIVSNSGVSIPDSVKLNFGADDDLQIYHDGNDSRITDTGTGNLYIVGSSNIKLLSAQTEYASFGTAVELRYNNSKKFETTSSGVAISGNAAITGAATAQVFSANANIDTPTLEVTTLKARDGSAAGSIANSTGVVTLGSAILTTADINGGSADNVVIGGSTAAAGTFTTINGTTSTVTTSNATTVDTTNLEVTNLKAKDGTAAGSIADSTGVVTLASSVLTTADINGGTADNVVIGGSTAAAGTFTTGTIATADINGGAIDGTVIGGSTAAAGNFTTLGATGLISGGDLALTDSTPKIQFNDTDGTNQKTEQAQAGGSFVTTVRNDTNHGVIDFKSNNGTNSLLRFRVAADGDFNFYENNGSTVGVKWDAPNGRLGIGTTTPSTTLDVVGKIETSEGIYLGGTGGAHLLDYYEEGTWTPVFRDEETGGNVATGQAFNGSYTRIGNACTLHMRIINLDPDTDVTGTNNVYITGLPFAASDENSSYRYMGSMESTRISYSGSIQPRITENTNYMVISKTNQTGSTTALQWDDISDIYSDMYVSITYTV